MLVIFIVSYFTMVELALFRFILTSVRLLVSVHPARDFKKYYKSLCVGIGRIQIEESLRLFADYAARRRIEGPGHKSAGYGNHFHQIHRTFLACLGEEAKPDFFVDLDQHLSRDLLDCITSHASAHQNSHVFQNVLASITREADQHKGSHPITSNVMSTNDGHRRRHAGLDDPGGPEGRRNRDR